MGWKTEVYFVIGQVCSLQEVFSLTDIYKYRDYFATQYPNNDHIEEKIRQTLQYLRNDGIIEFIDDKGNYKRIK